MHIGTIRTSFPGARERTRHAVLACLSIDTAAFKSLLLGAGCHGRANHQTGSRPAPALFARGNLMGRRLVLRPRRVVSQTSGFGRGFVRVDGESHTTRCAARESICCARRSRVPRVLALKAPGVQLRLVGACVAQYGSGEPYLPILEALAVLSHRDGAVFAIAARRGAGQARSALMAQHRSGARRPAARARRRSPETHVARDGQASADIIDEYIATDNGRTTRGARSRGASAVSVPDRDGRHSSQA
jgi:hypothetical protein